MTESTTEVLWQKPGPGNWELDTAHFRADVSQMAIDIMTDAVPAGTKAGFTMIGAPVERMDSAFVHGRFYRRLVPPIGGDSDRPAPPAAGLWLATRLLPVFRKREKIAAKSLAERSWMNEYQRWIEQWEPELLAFNRRWSAIEVGSLSDSDLAEHIATLYDHLLESTALHFRLHISDLGPIGLLLVRAREWGLPEVDVMTTLTGSSPATTAPNLQLDELRRIVAENDIEPEDLAAVSAISPRAAQLLNDYLDEYGHRLTTGYDLTDLTLAELPHVVVATIAANPTSTEVDTVGDDTAARLRQRVPESDRAEFDEMVDDARLLYGLRDANGPLTYQWPAGLLRRAVLDAAQRLRTAGRLDSQDHVFALHASEIIALLSDTGGPTAAEAATRGTARVARLGYSAPKWLGSAEEPPAASLFPGALRQLMAVIYAVLELLESETEEPFTGTGIGHTAIEGYARVVVDADEALSRVEPGDIVIAPFTVPTYNAVLAMAGGVVVEHGGLLCHTAVIARELGIPAVVGVAGATSDIPDGALIQIDPAAGEVRIL